MFTFLFVSKQVFYLDLCILDLVDLEKHSTPKHVRGHLRIQKFLDDPVLCPVAALEEYQNRVSVF